MQDIIGRAPTDNDVALISRSVQIGSVCIGKVFQAQKMKGTLRLSADGFRCLLTGALYKGLADAYLVRYIDSISDIDRASRRSSLEGLLDSGNVCNWCFTAFVSECVKKVKDLRSLGAALDPSLDDEVAISFYGIGSAGQDVIQAAIERAITSKPVREALERISMKISIAKVHQ